MPREQAHTAVGEGDAARDPGLPAEGVQAPPENMEAIIRRAKDIMAGRVRPAPMPTPPAVAARLERDLKGRQPAPEPEAVRKIADWLNLQAHYGADGPVACFTTAEGVLAVLAVGPDEIGVLFQGLSPEEAARVVVEHPDPPVGVPWPAAAGSPPAP